MSRALEAAMSELCFGAPIDPADDAAVGAWLDRHGVEARHREAILSGDRARLFLYRRLVRNNLRAIIERVCPRTVARLGRDRFEESFQRFNAERGARTHYLRDVPGEYLEWASEAWASDPSVPRWLVELGRHEALQLELSAQTTSPRPVGDGEPTLDRGLVFVDACRLVRLSFALHELPGDPQDDSEPVARPVALFAYRSAAHEIRYVELGPLLADVTELLLKGEALGVAIRTACERHDVVLGEVILGDVARHLADLAERGALLGPAVRASEA